MSGRRRPAPHTLALSVDKRDLYDSEIAVLKWIAGLCGGELLRAAEVSIMSLQP